MAAAMARSRLRVEMAAVLGPRLLLPAAAEAEAAEAEAEAEADAEVEAGAGGAGEVSSPKGKRSALWMGVAMGAAPPTTALARAAAGSSRP